MEIERSTPKTVKDPVCGMDVVPGIARSWDYLYEGIVYHFCGSECRSRFQADPKKILRSEPGQPAADRSRAAVGERQTFWSALRMELKKWRDSIF